MPALRRTLLLLAALVALVLVPAPSRACNIPVFRYAIDRWPSDPYRLTVFHRGPLTAEHRDLIKALERHADEDHPPVALELVDLAETPGGVEGVPTPKADAELPSLVVRYPAATRINVPVWSGSLKAGAPAAILDSPARREIAKRILGGDSAVWILLAGGDAAKDDAAEKRLRTEVQKLEKELKLPTLTAAPEDQLLGGDDRPLKLAFSVLRVNRKDPAEEMLVKMLINTESDLPGRSDPMVFTVFGRGRTMPALVGAGITPENIKESAAFLVGPCSCELKRDNPGVDLLFTADWRRVSTSNPAPAAPIPPGTLVPIPQAPPAPTPEPEVPVASAPPMVSPRHLLMAGIGVAGILVAFTGAMLLRSRRRLPQ
jgi:hypothetical protein